MAEIELKDLDAPKKLDAQDQEEYPPLQSPMKVYLQPKWATKLIYENKGLLATLLFLAYFCEMVGYISSVNFYSDADRLIPCTYTGELSRPENATKVYDMPILLLGIFHLISWLRVTLLLVIALLNVNLMIFWYITIPNTIFGIATYVMTFMTYYGESGETCMEVQPQRAQYLFVEICACWFFILVNFIPFLLCCMSKDKHDENLRKKDEEDDDDDFEEEGDE